MCHFLGKGCCKIDLFIVFLFKAAKGIDNESNLDEWVLYGAVLDKN